MDIPINGIVNIGNTCYLNATLQFIIHSSLIDHLKIISENKNLPLTEYILNLYKKNNAMPIELKKYLSTKNEELFNNNIQQDSHECLISILDILHEETKNIRTSENRKNLFLNRLSKNEYKKSSDTWESYKKTFGYSIINSIFSGQFLSILYCTGCKHESYVFDIFNEIQLIPDENNTSINSCLNNFMTIEDLENKDCSHCSKKTSQKRKLSFWDFPNSLVVNLKRYTASSRNNINIYMDKELLFENNGKKFKYKLVSMIHHNGRSQNSGHYVITISQNDIWYLIDDDTVRIINKNELNNSTTAYILLYELIQE